MPSEDPDEMQSRTPHRQGFSLRAVTGFAVLALIIGALLGYLERQMHEFFEQQQNTAPARGGPTNPPVKVGGGAISFQTDPSSTWTKDGNGGYCLAPASSSGAVFIPKRITVHSAGEDGDSDSAAVNGQPWTLIVKGSLNNNPKPPTVSPRGLQAEGGKSGVCAGGIHVFPYDLNQKNQSGFYPDDPEQISPNASLVRFQDLSGSLCTGPNGTGATGDEDICEQLFEIDLTVGPPANPTQKLTTTCADMRCVVHLN